eukprot:3890483-Amphidinium_carterae.1
MPPKKDLYKSDLPHCVRPTFSNEDFRSESLSKEGCPWHVIHVILWLVWTLVLCGIELKVAFWTSSELPFRFGSVKIARKCRCSVEANAIIGGRSWGEQVYLAQEDGKKEPQKAADLACAHIRSESVNPPF